MQPDKPVVLKLNAIVEEGFQRHMAGDLAGAQACYEQVLKLAPRNAFALHSLGLIALSRQDHISAGNLIKQAVAIEPGNGQFNSNLGVALLAGGRIDEALLCHEKAVSLDGNNAEFHFNRGTALVGAGRLEEATAAFQKAVTLFPDDGEFLFSLGSVLAAREKFDDARPFLSKAADIFPNNAEYQFKLGSVLFKLELLEPAADCLRKSVALDPVNPSTLCSLGVVLIRLVQMEDAKLYLERAMALDPNDLRYPYNLGYVCLALGDFAKGWELSLTRFKLSSAYYENPKQLPSVDFQTPSFTPVVVVKEQGFGDEIQFCRFLPQLKRRFPNLRWCVSPALARIFQASFPDIDVYTDVARASEGMHAVLPIMSAPWILNISSIDDIPSNSYLKVPPGALTWSLKLPPTRRPRVGIVWGGNANWAGATGKVDYRRSLTVDLVKPLLLETSVEWISLQKDRPEQLQELLAIGCQLRDYSEHLKDFASTAALIDQLDLVIAVDTSVVHLAGALGKPVWMLNRFDSCWRWMIKRDDSPWYPTMRIFQQTSPGDWPGVVRRVVDALVEFANSR